jgi:hypothetical protein
MLEEQVAGSCVISQQKKPVIVDPFCVWTTKDSVPFVMLFAFVHVPVHVPRIDKILLLVPPDPTALWRTTGVSAVPRRAISPGNRTLYASNMPAPRVRATTVSAKGAVTDPKRSLVSDQFQEGPLGKASL